MIAAARWPPASGLLAAAALSLTGLIAPPPPVAGAPGATVVAYYAAHQVSLEVESLIDAVGMTLLIVFAGTLQARLKSTTSSTAFGAACVVAACTLVQVAAFQAHAYGLESDPSQAALLNDFQAFAFQVTTFPSLVFLAASSVGILATRSLPRWLGLAGAAAAALQAVSWISFFATTGSLAAGGIPDIMSFVALLAWVAACSVAMLVSGRQPGQPIS